MHSFDYHHFDKKFAFNQNIFGFRKLKTQNFYKDKTHHKDIY